MSRIVGPVVLPLVPRAAWPQMINYIRPHVVRMIIIVFLGSVQREADFCM